MYMLYVHVYIATLKKGQGVFHAGDSKRSKAEGDRQETQTEMTSSPAHLNLFHPANQ